MKRFILTVTAGMKQINTLIFIGIFSIGLLLTACTSSGASFENAYIYNGINFGADRDEDFKQGVRDACKTADGDYTKDHTMFKNNVSYRVGWEDGRLQCKGNK